MSAPWVDHTLRRIESHLRLASSRGFGVERVGDLMWRVLPRGLAPALPYGKDTALALMGLVHGNEIQGLDILAELAEGLASGWFIPKTSLLFIVGNPEGARQGLRYTERDLNRSFARKDPLTTCEERRAREIEPALRRCLYLVDFHQTTQESPFPFFIYPYTRASYDWAREIDPRTAMITHWGDPFSTEGVCTDEYLNAHEGLGLTIELGQAGISDFKRGAGVSIALRALASVTRRLDGVHTPTPDHTPGEIYTFAETIPWPDGHVQLDPGWNNFMPITKGQRLGTRDNTPILAPTSGFMLFPKYLDAPGHPPQKGRPEELCRILRRVSENELPEK
jgi:succinylglutamate desuccinylase